MAKKLPAFNLPLADNLFSTQEGRDEAKLEKVMDVPLNEIDSFPNHPFQVKIDEAMQVMVDSIIAVGIQTPAVVRLKDDGRYEMVSGHRRKLACELAGLETIPCIVRDMSLDEATVIMVDSNLQREVILPSEKAKSYKMRLDAMKRQGRRTDLTSDPLGHKLSGKRSRAILAENCSDSYTQIQRYIRLTELVPPLLDLVDNERIALRPAVELSYLTQEHQQLLLDFINKEGCTPSHIQAVKLRKLSEDGCLSVEAIQSIMQEGKSNPPGHFKLSKEKIHRFFSADTSTKVIEETIIKALELWRDSNK